MGLEWEGFENLKEIVYVTDMDTNQLVYMNKYAKEMLEIPSEKAYKGKICYRLLQGKDKPCEFCTNADLKEGCFKEWRYYNSILDREYLLKDTLIQKDGKRYRLEIAINVNENRERDTFFYSQTEKIISDCLEYIASLENATDAINRVLQYIGEVFKAERAYIFEITEKDKVSNTYEWCAKDVVPQIEFLRNVPIETIDWWLRKFKEGDVIRLEDIEEIRTSEPQTYAILKPQNIHSLLAGPIYDGEQVVGFVGVDNPNPRMYQEITSFIKVIGYFLHTLFRRRDLVNKLNYTSYFDALTGAMNRHALFETYGRGNAFQSLGVIFCDISGLKKVNDTLGHEAGDLLIKDAYNIIQKALDTTGVFRVGGDEFVVVLTNRSESEFETCVEQLKRAILKTEHHIAVGGFWSDQKAVSLDEMISRADERMYENKKVYYNALTLREENEVILTRNKTLFYEYMKSYYFDAEALFQSITLMDASHYIYFGDMQTNMYYISDNMRDNFGFKSNIVHDLITQWEDRIVTLEHKEMYRRDVSKMVQEKGSNHDLRYKVQDVNGNMKWVHCRGCIQWDKKKECPLFFSGSISTQDDAFIVDPITTFPREHSALNMLNKLDKQTKIIAFSFNKFSDVNNTIGRYQANILMQNIAKRMIMRYGSQGDFFRLEGIRFLFIVKEAQVSVEECIEEFKKIVDQEYQIMKISVQNSSSYGVIEYPNGVDTPQELMENAVTLISCAKNQPNKPYVVYSPDNIEELKQMAAMEILLIQDVLQNMRNFRIVIQPVISTKTKLPIGGEVLLRWNFEGKDISPTIFVPLLERNNVIQMVGKWVYEQTIIHCRQLMHLNPDFYLTFNVSYLQISDEDFLTFIEEKLHQYQISGKNVVAELTETHFDENPQKLKQFVKRCNALGIRIALDDFGTAYSSIRLLLSYSVSIVKLDRSLLLEMSESEEKMNFISSIVYACHRFGKIVCMEGVETEEQSEMISDAECDMIQGFYYYRPMETREIYKLLVNK